MRHAIATILLCSLVVAGCAGSGGSGHRSKPNPVETIFVNLFGAIVNGMFGGGAFVTIPETGVMETRDYVDGVRKTLVIDAAGTQGLIDVVVATESGEVVVSRLEVPANAGTIELPIPDEHDDEYWRTTIRYYDHVGRVEVSLKGYRSATTALAEGEIQ